MLNILNSIMSATQRGMEERCYFSSAIQSCLLNRFLSITSLSYFSQILGALLLEGRARGRDQRIEEKSILFLLDV